MTWPLALRLGDAVPKDLGDPAVLDLGDLVERAGAGPSPTPGGTPRSSIRPAMPWRWPIIASASASSPPRSSGPEHRRWSPITSPSSAASSSRRRPAYALGAGGRRPPAGSVRRRPGLRLPSVPRRPPRTRRAALVVLAGGGAALPAPLVAHAQSLAAGRAGPGAHAAGADLRLLLLLRHAARRRLDRPGSRSANRRGRSWPSWRRRWRRRCWRLRRCCGATGRRMPSSGWRDPSTRSSS